MYHSISSDLNSFSVNPQNFEKQMNFMNRNNYKTTSLNNLDDLDQNSKYFIITFDDGYEDVYYNALPILKKFGFTSICYFVTDLIGHYNIWDKNKKDFKQLKLMDIDKINFWLKSGMEIGAHTSTHKNLSKLNYIQKKIEILSPKKFFKKKFSIDISSFSYPFGKFDNESVNLVKENYINAVTTKRSRYKNNKFDKYMLPRVPINKTTNMFKFFLKISTPYEDIKYK